jgi:hypothetical protein
MIFIKIQLIIDPKCNQHGNGHTYGEPSDVDSAIAFAPYHVAPGDLEIVFYHKKIV